MMIKAELIEKSVFCFCVMLFVSYAYHVQNTPSTYKSRVLEISESAPEVQKPVSVIRSENTEYSVVILDDDFIGASEGVYQASSSSELALNIILAKVFSPIKAAL